MTRQFPRTKATQEKTLIPFQEQCEQCGQPLWVATHNHRTVTTVSGVWRLTLVVRQCVQPNCPNYHRRYNPEDEGRWALPHGEFGLDVIALIGMLYTGKYDQKKRSGLKIHQDLLAHGITISQRSVTSLIHRYEKMMEWPNEQVQAKLQQQGRVLLAIDKLQPDAAYHSLYVIRDYLSAEILLARLLPNGDDLHNPPTDIKNLLIEVKVRLRKLGIGVAKGIIINGKEIVDLSQLLYTNH